MPRSQGIMTVGTYTADIILHSIPHIAGPGEVLFLNEPPALEPGGHAVNVSIDLAQLGAPGPLTSVGAVGRDWFADFLTGAQRARGVEPRVEAHTGAGTARNIIIVVRGEDRRFHVYRGANTLLTPPHVSRELEERPPGILYLAAGHSPRIDEALGDLLGWRGDAIAYVDPAYTSPESVVALEKALPHADLIHLNTLELQMLTGEKRIGDAIARLARATRATVLVTSGEGVKAIMPRESKVLEMPSFRVEPVDPTGAGDAFSAGLLWRIARRGGLPPGVEELAEDLLYAQAAGAAAVSAPGATSGVTRERVEELVRSQGDGILEKVRLVGV